MTGVREWAGSVKITIFEVTECQKSRFLEERRGDSLSIGSLVARYVV
jgi:hypothetical protein